MTCMVELFGCWNHSTMFSKSESPEASDDDVEEESELLVTSAATGCLRCASALANERKSNKLHPHSSSHVTFCARKSDQFGSCFFGSSDGAADSNQKPRLYIACN